MDIETFLETRRPAWSRLEHLLASAERSPLWEFGPSRLRELVTLYRQACSDLNQARAMTANPEILDRLNQLTGQAYRFIYQEARQEALWGSVKEFFVTQAPLAFQRHSRYVAASVAALLLGALFGFTAVLADPGLAEDLVPTEFFTARPQERVERIEKGRERVDDTEKALLFGASLYVHNIQVSFLCFALGAVTIVAAPLLLLYNGVLLGALAALYWIDGVALFFVGWVGPHGSLELPAIVLSAAAGMCAGRALLLPGSHSRGEALRAVAPYLWRMMGLIMVLLICAGLIEGSFSQFSARSASYGLKVFVAAGFFAALCAYLFYPRRGGAGGAR